MNNMSGRNNIVIANWRQIQKRIRTVSNDAGLNPADPSASNQLSATHESRFNDADHPPGAP